MFTYAYPVASPLPYFVRKSGERAIYLDRRKPHLAHRKRERDRLQLYHREVYVAPRHNPLRRV